MDVSSWTARELRDRVAAGEADPRDALEACLRKIRERDGELRAFLHVSEEAARRQAEAVRERVRRGDASGALLGVPVAVKDNQCTRFAPTTCASRILEGYEPPYDAGAVERILAHGGIVVGKTNLDEFAMGSSCEHSAFGPTRNPLDPARIPGGSSGGSAAAVAAGMAWLATGSDTGGSIRQPAACCGIVGLKPTYGRVSRYGLVAFASSLDQIGPMARSVGDAALMMNSLAGHDPRDATSDPRPAPDCLAGLEDGVRGMRLGMPREYFGEGIDPGVRERVLAAADALREAGASVEECSLPHTPWAIATYYVVATAEASSNLARYDGVRYGLRVPGDLAEMYCRTRSRGFGMEVKRRILLGTFVLSSGYYDAYYGRALQVRTLIREDFRRAFASGLDAVVCPTSPVTAFGFGERLRDPLAMYLSDVYTVAANLAGLPGISVPCGETPGGLPAGFQAIGNHFEEPKILRIARAVEKVQGRRSGATA
ncbi:MAG: Asp-tRNA(Asn)/Glu-tRNA(Gln) amidotransferase subunit GatA [Planctomycetes bacterium]|jgi:aspartyl-tRNA(Asn)/glutamyl-tRNA(Gln) amidotransferase subunit A|nr:Asp-tRNA(Asn)/Glu-tRNA(Gln) amidotransferase subunit GatA [Planctomycetota bacterium]